MRISELWDDWMAGRWTVALDAHDGKIQVLMQKNGYRDTYVSEWCTTAVQVVDAMRQMQEVCDDKNRREKWARDTARRYR